MTNFGSSRTRRRSMMIDTRHHSSVQNQTDGKIILVVEDQLPGMDGITLYDRLHANTDPADIPAIIMSANLPTQALQERHLTGVAKPFELDQLLHTIEQLLA